MKHEVATEQHIAVFGEAGSGKTVLVSSFYGHAREHASDAFWGITSDALKQGNVLYQNWLGMRDESRAPETNRLNWTQYSFDANLARPSKVDARLRLVWHDYPGEWFEEEPSEPEEKQRRIEALKALMSSHVALLMVDAQRLIDNRGQEHAYLKSLFHNFSETLRGVRDDLLEDGKPLGQFPRIWFIALSKADLLPEVDAEKFRDLVIGAAGSDLNAFIETIESLVEEPRALSIGKDFIRLSSAKFTPDSVDVTQRLGVDLIVPIAALVPLERFAAWGKHLTLPPALRKALMEGGQIVLPLVPKVALVLVKRLPKAMQGLVASALEKFLDDLAKKALEYLAQERDDALADQDGLRAAIAQAAIDLKQAEVDGVLLKDH